MSAVAPRNSYRIAEEQEWLESSDNAELSPASVWAPDYDDEDETTLPGRRAQYIDLMSPNIEKEAVGEPPRQVRILDESQVLPGEASFATVNLNQPFEESVLNPQNSCEPISTSNDDDSRERRSASRVKLLDESQVLAGEASFATVLGERTKAPRHSPITEFLVKTKLSLKQLVLAMLALVSVLALAVIVLLSMTRSEVVTASSAPPPPAVETASQSVSTSTASHESVLTSDSQGRVSESASPTQVVAAVGETQSAAEAKVIERPSSDDSRKAPSSDAKSGAVRQEILREPKERVVETKKQSASVGKKAVKEQAVVKTPNASVRSEPPETHPKPATVVVENVETKTPPITGGGERPRTVTRKPSP
jgi:hypothetical protein